MKTKDTKKTDPKVKKLIVEQLLTEEQKIKIRETAPVTYRNHGIPGKPYVITENGKKIGMIDNIADAEYITDALSAVRRGINGKMAEKIIYDISCGLALNWESNLYLHLSLFPVVAPNLSNKVIKERFQSVFNQIYDDVASNTGFEPYPF